MSDMEMIEAYPLYWPAGWSRTDKNMITHSRFDNTLGRATNALVNEIEMLTGRRTESIISTNIKLRRDGLPYASGKLPEDSGVAVYFKYHDKDMCFACDKFRQVWENMVSIKKTIEAIRGIERWGASDMMERAFKGFVALEYSEGSVQPWRHVLDVSHDATLSICEKQYKRLRSTHHPDKGGDKLTFYKVEQAIKEARVELAKEQDVPPEFPIDYREND